MAEIPPKHGNIKFTNEIDSQLKVIVDPTHTYRIFHNLLRNAVQAMQGDETGKNTNKLTVSAVALDEKVCIRISDTGPGLPDNVKNNLFKAFTTGVGKGGYWPWLDNRSRTGPRPRR